MTVDDKDLKSRQEVRRLLERAAEAQKAYARFSQAEVNRVTAAAVRAGSQSAELLAELAVEESGFGRVDSKTIKNVFATKILWEDIQDLKTAGVIHRDDRKGVLEIAEPYGVILGIIPITNPTSTALFKGIIALKTRNAAVFSPHPKGVRCIGESVRVMAEAAERAGAPQGLLSCMQEVSMAGIEEAMHHPLTSLILATGGEAMVKAAYSAGKPAYGVGPGNAPAFIERTADVRAAVKAVVASQTFDNGTICSSEQSVVIDAPVKRPVLREFQAQGAHLCDAREKALLEKIIARGGRINPDIVGRYPWQLAEMAGFSVDKDCTVLLAEEDCVGPEHPLSMEKLSPILAVYTGEGWERCCEICLELLRFGGMGHTLAIHSRNEEVILTFALEKPVHRILVNAPTSQGAVGYATGLVPSMTLGCGALGGNITSDNVSAKHLMLIKRLARIKPGFLEREENRRRATYRPGHAAVEPPKPASSKAAKEAGAYAYQNTAFNEPAARPAAFSLPREGRAAEEKRPAPAPAAQAAPVPKQGEARIPPERCPLGCGCDQCKTT